MLSQSRALQGCSCSGRLPASPFAVVARAAHASSRPRAVSLVTRAKKEAVQEVGRQPAWVVGQECCMVLVGQAIVQGKWAADTLRMFGSQ